MNTMFVATAKQFTKEGKETDKNGYNNVFFSLRAGKCPNKALVLSGTIAAREDIEIGKTYLLSAMEQDVDDQYGRQFSVEKVSEMSVMEILSAPASLGAATVVDVSAPTIEEETKS